MCHASLVSVSSRCYARHGHGIVRRVLNLSRSRLKANGASACIVPGVVLVNDPQADSLGF